MNKTKTELSNRHCVQTLIYEYLCYLKQDRIVIFSYIFLFRDFPR